ncbi:RNA-binding protein [Chelativorans intermedius]|uniref:RNA-binding protein n=1 Tax=Chelativorans intermedius TaxID=515947 RepID=A0ABV6DD33_9HYPH|nr:RNA-binding protein [Chelativorans intermedius]MCT8998186.1 RNA-binding protein [Chelativorans intermedius]
MNERTCIVTRQNRPPEALIRFVAGPDGTVVPDLKRNLPGRGCWVGAEKALVARAAAKNLFARALKAPVKAPPDLAERVDSLLAATALGALGLARKGGAVALGATKVETAVRSGRAAVVLHAAEAAQDGIRKIAAARKAVSHAGGPDVPAFELFSEAEMSLALGATNVIHAAVLDRGPGMAAVKRVKALAAFRGIAPEMPASSAAPAAEDVE